MNNDLTEWTPTAEERAEALEAFHAARAERWAACLHLTAEAAALLREAASDQLTTQTLVDEANAALCNAADRLFGAGVGGGWCWYQRDPNTGRLVAHPWSRCDHGASEAERREARRVGVIADNLRLALKVMFAAREAPETARSSHAAVLLGRADALARAVGTAHETAHCGDGAPADATDEPLPPALGRSERIVLRVLRQAEPVAVMTVAQIAALSMNDLHPGERVSDRAAGSALRALIDRGWAERPNGARSGARLTTKGRRAASKIAG
jgi:hypothetical protein